MTLESTNRIVVRGYVPEDEPRVMEIIERVWGTDTREDHAFLWKWKHELDASRQMENNIAQVIVIDGKIEGYSGAIPVKIKVKDQIVEGVFLLDTFTDPESRGSGVRLMKQQLKDTFILIGAANSRTKELWNRLAKKDTVLIRNAHKMIRLLDPTELLINNKVPPLFAKPVGFVWRFMDGLRNIKLGKADNKSLCMEKVEKFPQAIDELLHEFAKEFKFIIIRSHDYLNWRYASCPFQYEKWILWKDAKPVGYMVFRVGMLNNRKTIILNEMMAIEQKDHYYSVMLSKLHEDASQCGASDIQTINTGCKVFEKELGKNGYYSRKEPLPIIGQFNDNLISDYDLYSGEDLYLSVGDADFEFIFFKQGINSIVRSEN